MHVIDCRGLDRNATSPEVLRLPPGSGREGRLGRRREDVVLQEGATCLPLRPREGEVQVRLAVRRRRRRRGGGGALVGAEGGVEERPAAGAAADARGQRRGRGAQGAARDQLHPRIPSKIELF